MMQMTKTMDGFVKKLYEKILKNFPTGIIARLLADPILIFLMKIVIISVSLM